MGKKYQLGQAAAAASVPDLGQSRGGLSCGERLPGMGGVQGRLHSRGEHRGDLWGGEHGGDHAAGERNRGDHSLSTLLSAPSCASPAICLMPQLQL